jgi:hypothetical protein
VGTVVWGHVTGVTEDNVQPFAVNWTGTGSIENSGDNERLALSAGQSMTSNVVNTGARHVSLGQNVYRSGDTVTLNYRTGATEGACTSASWTAYTTPFSSLGYVQVQVVCTL